MNSIGLSLLLVAATYVGVRLAVALLTDELRGWIPLICRLLVDAAAQKLPPREQARWREEWRAELAAKAERPLSALMYAFGIRRSASALAAELWGAEDTDRSPVADAHETARALRGRYDDGYITLAELREALGTPMRSLAGQDRLRFFVKWMLPACRTGVRNYFYLRRFHREQKRKKLWGLRARP